MKPDAYLAFLDLRLLLRNEIIPALEEMSRVKPGKGEFIRIPRHDEIEE